MKKEKPFNRHPKHNMKEGKAHKVTPYDDSQRVLEKGYSCAAIKDAMVMVTEDVLNNLFQEWLETKHYETERREFIYKLAISQGAVIQNMENAVMAKGNKTFELKGDDEDE